MGGLTSRKKKTEERSSLESLELLVSAWLRHSAVRVPLDLLQLIDDYSKQPKFKWDPEIQSGETRPERFVVSESGTVAEKTKGEWCNILCNPPIYRGTHSVKMKVDMSGKLGNVPYFYLGFGDVMEDFLQMGCSYHHADGININGATQFGMRFERSLGVGDEIEATIVFDEDMDISQPKAHVTFALVESGVIHKVGIEWKPKQLPVYAGFSTYWVGTTVTLT